MRPPNLIFTLLLLCSVSLTSFSQVASALPEKADLTKSITIYPNPATDFVHIKLATLKANQVKITLYNILGNEVSAETEVVDDHEVRIRVKEFSTGYYLIAVRDEQTQFRGTYKFLKR
jgi:hypothetical protein